MTVHFDRRPENMNTYQQEMQISRELLLKEGYEEMEGCYFCFCDMKVRWTMPILKYPREVCPKHSDKRLINGSIFVYKALILRAVKEKRKREFPEEFV